jgi:hypothetical protein
MIVETSCYKCDICGKVYLKIEDSDKHVCHKPSTKDEVFQIVALDKKGKKLAELFPSKKISNKRFDVLSLKYFNEENQRCTRFLNGTDQPERCRYCGAET